MITRGQNFQDVNQDELLGFLTQSRTANDEIMRRIAAEYDRPLRLFPSFPVNNSRLNIRGLQTNRVDGAAIQAPLVSKSFAGMSDKWIDFSNLTVSDANVQTNGGAFTIPATTVGSYRALAIVYRHPGIIDTAFSTESGFPSIDPSALFQSMRGRPLGWIILEAYGTGSQFKTPTSADGVIESDPIDAADSPLNEIPISSNDQEGIQTFSQTYTSALPATIAHGLDSVPNFFSLLYDEDNNGRYVPLDPASFIKADATNLYTNTGGLTISAGNELILKVGVV